MSKEMPSALDRAQEHILQLQESYAAVVVNSQELAKASDKQQNRIAELEAELAVTGERLDYAVSELREILTDPEDIDPRMRYVTVQIDKVTLAALRGWLESLEDKT